MISSVKPSAKKASEGSGLRLSKGSTTMDFLPSTTRLAEGTFDASDPRPWPSAMSVAD